jgi:curved DNA-binding protein CbpA
MDPYAVLGIGPDASPREVAAAYRRLAKRFHPDRAGERGARRMAEINAAYDQLRDVHAPSEPAVAGATAAARGAWLRDEIRERIGPELLRVLSEGEPVDLVVGASTWASPHTLLAVSDRRLLWLLDDAVSHRVRYVDFSDVAAVDHRLAWPRKRTASLRVDLHNGRRLTFADLRPETAAALALHIRERLRPRTART